MNNQWHQPSDII